MGDETGSDHLKKLGESRKKISEFFESERKRLREKAGEGNSLFNISFTLKNRNILGIVNSIQLECMEMAQDASIPPEKIIDWAKKQIAKEEE